MPPPVRYARNGELNIAYQVVGDGSADLLLVPGWFSHLVLDWEEPTWVRWCERLASFARVVRFDKRGTGMSDRPPGIPTPDERMADARAVMDAAGLTSAHVLGWSEGGPLRIMLAAAHPERVRSPEAGPLHAVGGEPGGCGRPRQVERVDRHARALAFDPRTDAGAEPPRRSSRSRANRTLSSGADS